MKKTIGILLATAMIFAACAACSKADRVKKAPLKMEDNGIVGVWTIDSNELKESSDPLTGTLAKVLSGYFEDAVQIEFKDDGKAVVGAKEIDYKLEDKKLTLTWDGSQNFVFEIAGDNDNLELSYQGYLNLKLKKK